MEKGITARGALLRHRAQKGNSYPQTKGDIMEPTKAIHYARNNRERYLAELKELLAIPSISTLSQHKPDIQRAAEWLTKQIAGMGFENVELLSTAGHPVVYGEWLNAPGKPTILVYGHYDVQPVDPLSEWTTPPFEPTVRGESIFARGASDNKGQIFAALKALEALSKNEGLLLNVKVMIEGEEEIGSLNLGPFVEKHKDKLKCDIILNTDAAIPSPNLPAITYGLRGLAYFELWVSGPSQDLHSGVFGGSVANPAQVLCELIAGMHDRDGRITLPSFYDKVRKLPDDERAEIARMPFSDEEWRKTTGVPQLAGEKGFTTLERLGARPTLEVNGIVSGFTGEGSKTVLPAKAMAKISMRLVPYQDDGAVEEQLRDYLRRHTPPTVRWELKKIVSTSAVLVKRDTPAVRAATQALEATFGVKPVFKLEGGSVGVVSTFQTVLGIDPVQMGFSLPDDNFHSPNEKLHLPTHYRAVETYIRFFDAAAEK
jgi:acetylornithine deacetylase/succinyl-diaminopimelate desuccinylase-like protein